MHSHIYFETHEYNAGIIIIYRLRKLRHENLSDMAWPRPHNYIMKGRTRILVPLFCSLPSISKNSIFD